MPRSRRARGDRTSRAQRAGGPLSVEGHQQRNLWQPPPSSARCFVPGLSRGVARWPSGLASGNDGNGDLHPHAAP